jgi:UDP-4-amino-4,6-dideoxy-N-acetyl-beta-L-altrosamine transaminase
MTIPYGRQSLDDADIQAVVNVLKSDWLTCGPAVDRFEQKLCEVTGAKFAVACSNGTAALHLACMALGVGPKTRAVTTPITFLASANCVEFCGGSVDFVDIDPSTLCLSPTALSEHCAKNGAPDLVIPVDFAGVPADLPALFALSRKHGFRIIEDAAHSIGSTFVHHGRTIKCGSCEFSDLAILSFHPVKTITTGEGGAITTNSKELADKLRLYRSHGMTKDPAVLKRRDGPWYYEMHEIGYNCRITDIQCALGFSQLQKLDRFKTRRQEIVRRYTDAFSGNPTMTVQPWPSTTSPCFHLFTVQLAGGAGVRLRAFEQLRAQGILCQIHYYPVHLQPYYQQKYGYSEGKCPHAEKYYRGCLSLPLYPGMSDADVSTVISAVGAIAEA